MILGPFISHILSELVAVYSDMNSDDSVSSIGTQQDESTRDRNDHNDASATGSTDYPIQQLVNTINDTSIAIPTIMIDLSNDDDDDENDDICNDVYESPVKRLRHRYLLRSTTNDSSLVDCNSVSYEEDEEGCNDEIEVIEAPTIPDIVASDVEHNDYETNDDNEVEFIGTRNTTSYHPLPHIRSHCPTFIFPSLSMTTTTCSSVHTEKSGSNTYTNMVLNANKKPRTNNIDTIDIERKYCSLCYCLVCDTTVTNCTNWHTHCMATDVGPLKEYWLEQRQQQKHDRSVLNDTFNTTAPNIQSNSLLLLKTINRKKGVRRTKRGRKEI